MSMTYVLERHRKTDCCPVLSMRAHGALLWPSALNMSLGMLHYLHCAFLQPRWDMTGATGSSWIKQRVLKAQGKGWGWWGGLGRQQSTGDADCNAHVVTAWGAGGRWGKEGTCRDREIERDGRQEGKDFVEGERREREIDKSRKQKKSWNFLSNETEKWQTNTTGVLI